MLYDENCWQSEDTMIEFTLILNPICKEACDKLEGRLILEENS